MGFVCLLGEILGGEPNVKFVCLIEEILGGKPNVRFVCLIEEIFEGGQAWDLSVYWRRH